MWRMRRQTEKRKRTGEGLTKVQQHRKTRWGRRRENKMDSPVTFPSFKWAEFGTNDYFKAIDEINDVYRKCSRSAKRRKSSVPRSVQWWWTRQRMSSRRLEEVSMKSTGSTPGHPKPLCPSSVLMWHSFMIHASIVTHLGNSCLRSENHCKGKDPWDQAQHENSQHVDVFPVQRVPHWVQGSHWKADVWMQVMQKTYWGRLLH